MISYDYVGSALKFIFRLDEDPRLTSGMKDSIWILKYELDSLFNNA